MTINELITIAHSDAKAKGWWDEERNTGELLMLIVSECGEALEAHRSGKQSDLIAFDKNYEAMRQSGEESALSHSFRLCVKDGFADELADIVIRIADFLGHRGWIDDGIDLPGNVKVLFGSNVGEDLLRVTQAIATQTEGGLDAARRMVFEIANAHSIDLWRHIELKLAYNRTRSHKHGKAY